MRALAAALVVAAVLGVAESGLQVTTEGGRIQGKGEKSLNGRTFNSFYSIPYARPPIGENRFKDPVKPGTWQRLADATRPPPPCLSVSFIAAILGNRVEPEEISGSENCLFLNVFTPVTGSTPEKAKLPVMVWLHGGGFFSGSSDEYLPHSFLDHDVVLVVVQYRLGVLGFLSTEDSVMPGNLGLKDQTMALEWVQRNIHLFGGDKTRVTIFGESAGGASVHFQMLTPKSRGLFSQVIMQSGTALSFWATNARHREQAEKLGRNMGCEDVHNSTVFLACLQKIDAKELTAALQDAFEWLIVPLAFGPRVDGEYLPDLPAKLLMDKQYSEVNLLAGVTKHEGGMVTLAMDIRKNVFADLKENFAVLGPISVGTDDEDDGYMLAKAIYEHHMGDITFDEAHYEQLTQLYTDMFFAVSHDEVTARHAEHFPDRHTFRYQFDYRGEKTLCDVYNSEMGKHWVSHADELIYLFAGGTLFGPLFPKGLTAPGDIHMRKLLLKMWVNFATSGNPTPDASQGFTWQPSTADNLQYLSITSSPSMQPYSRKEVREFYASLPLTNSRILFPQKHQQQQQQQQQEHQKQEQQQQQTKTERFNQDEL